MRARARAPTTETKFFYPIPFVDLCPSECGWNILWYERWACATYAPLHPCGWNTRRDICWNSFDFWVVARNRCHDTVNRSSAKRFLLKVKPLQTSLRCVFAQTKSMRKQISKCGNPLHQGWLIHFYVSKLRNHNVYWKYGRRFNDNSMEQRIRGHLFRVMWKYELNGIDFTHIDSHVQILWRKINAFRFIA